MHLVKHQQHVHRPALFQSGETPHESAHVQHVRAPKCGTGMPGEVPSQVEAGTLTGQYHGDLSEVPAVVVQQCLGRTIQK